MHVSRLITYIYTEKDEDVNELAEVIVGFINEQREMGNVVTAKKLTSAIRNWKSNPMVKGRIIRYFEEG